MAKVAIALRLTPEALEWLDGYAKSRRSSRQVVLEAAVESFRADVLGGVPDLTPEPKRSALKVRTGELTRAHIMGDRQARLNEAKAKGSR